MRERASVYLLARLLRYQSIAVPATLRSLVHLLWLLLNHRFLSSLYFPFDPFCCFVSAPSILSLFPTFSGRYDGVYPTQHTIRPTTAALTPSRFSHPPYTDSSSIAVARSLALRPHPPQPSHTACRTYPVLAY